MWSPWVLRVKEITRKRLKFLRKRGFKERSKDMKIWLSLLAGVVSFFLLSVNPPVFADDDDRIESSFKDSYSYKKYLEHDDIDIDAEGGLVTLTGTVDSDSHKRLAAETAEELPGVKSVDNRLEVKEANETSDGWISTKVKAALLFHRSVSGLDTEVYVKDGIVTLRGQADNIAQKDLTSQYASDIEGVKNVKNEMTVAEPPRENEQTFSEKVDDASITAQVKGALFAHRSTSALRTDVETENGIVTLKGTAKNQAEKDLVTKLVADIDGVKDVENDMEISK
jgi:osmotically-inducible protein OsmY